MINYGKFDYSEFRFRAPFGACGYRKIVDFEVQDGTIYYEGR